MLNTQSTLVTISSIIVTFFVPAVVWITLGAGLLQLVHAGIRRLGAALTSWQRLTRTAR